MVLFSSKKMQKTLALAALGGVCLASRSNANGPPGVFAVKMNGAGPSLRQISHSIAGQVERIYDRAEADMRRIEGELRRWERELSTVPQDEEITYKKRYHTQYGTYLDALVDCERQEREQNRLYVDCKAEAWIRFEANVFRSRVNSVLSNPEGFLRSVGRTAQTVGRATLSALDDILRGDRRGLDRRVQRTLERSFVQFEARPSEKRHYVAHLRRYHGYSATYWRNLEAFKAEYRRWPSSEQTPQRIFGERLALFTRYKARVTASWVRYTANFTTGGACEWVGNQWQNLTGSETFSKVSGWLGDFYRGTINFFKNVWSKIGSIFAF